MVEDPAAREQALAYERRKGEPQNKAPTHIYRSTRSTSDVRIPKVQEVYTPGLEQERQPFERLDSDKAPVEEAIHHMDKSEHPEGGGVAGPTLRTHQNGVASNYQSYDDDNNPWA